MTLQATACFTTGFVHELDNQVKPACVPSEVANMLITVQLSCP